MLPRNISNILYIKNKSSIFGLPFPDSIQDQWTRVGGELHLPHPQSQSPGLGSGGMEALQPNIFLLCFRSLSSCFKAVHFCAQLFSFFVTCSGEGREARLFFGDTKVASESPAGGRKHDTQPALPSQERRSRLHPQDENGSEGRRTK